MGNDYKLSTKLLTDDLNLNDGTIDGNLYIKGFGNSVFSDSDLQELVDKLIQRGIKSISGNIIGDDSYLDDIHAINWAFFHGLIFLIYICFYRLESKWKIGPID